MKMENGALTDVEFGDQKQSILILLKKTTD